MDKFTHRLNEVLTKHLKKLNKRLKMNGDTFKATAPVSWMKSIGTVRLQGGEHEENLKYVAQAAGPNDIIFMPGKREDINAMGDLLIAKPEGRCTKVSTHGYSPYDLMAEWGIPAGWINDIWIIKWGETDARKLDNLYSFFGTDCRRFIFVD